MWNVIASNRILEVKMRRQAYRRHINTLKNIKGQIDMSQPAKFTFLTNKMKSKQINLQQQREINHENCNLLLRMLRNNSKSQSQSNQCFPKESLNETQFRKISEEINHQNKKLLLRLNDTSPSINFVKFQKQYKSKQKIKTNISRLRPMSGVSTNRSINERPKTAR